MYRFSIIVATCGGDPFYLRLKQRALASARAQSHPTVEVIDVHGGALDEARNRGARMARNEWLVFLDADDQLKPDYIAEMARVNPKPDRLYYPAVEYTDESGFHVPPMLHSSDGLLERNFMCIGTLVHRDVFFEHQGFSDLEMYEDWDLWMRICAKGAGVQPVPKAVYSAYLRAGSRNRAAKPVTARVVRRIRRQFTHREAGLLKRIVSVPSGGLVPGLLEEKGIPNYPGNERRDGRGWMMFLRMMWGSSRSPRR